MEAQLEALAGSLDVTWIVVATVLVMFMQAGFALLEIGFSRGKNVGHGVAKILANFSIATIAWWAIGFGIAFGGAGWLMGDDALFFSFGENVATGPVAGAVGGSTAAFMLFQFMFWAVSLAIVWGTTLERMKFSAYVIYATVFAALIYPLGAHWIFGGGFLSEIGNGVQDFAGSTVVHLVGATGALAALLLLGPRLGKYGADGKPRAIPGHSMPLVGLGVIAASLVTWLKTKALDVGMGGNGAIAGLVAITAPSGYVEFWAAPIIGAVGGVIVVLGVLAIERVLDDPVGALSAHGLAGIWGTLACGIFTSPRYAELNGVGDPGLWYSGSFEQLGAQALGVGVAFACVFAVSYAVFGLIKYTIGIRVTPEQEEAGLDIVEHGMYGYPEQFIPPEEYPGGPTPAPAPAASAVT